MKIMFHENQLSYRGTSVSLFDYAHYNEKLLGNDSVIVFNRLNTYNSTEAIKKFKSRFRVLSYTNLNELDEIIKNEAPDVFYAIKSGEKDAILTERCKCCIHAVFKVYEPHGDVYAYVSDWLSTEMGVGANFVPHIINVLETEECLRQELNIPSEAKVFGYYGGTDSFDIAFVQEAVKEIAKSDQNIYFLFMGVDDFSIKKKFWQKRKFYPNIIFLPSNSDLIYKSKFINTCSAMLHGRKRGETFGMAIGEFAIKGIPIITYINSPEGAHYQFLSDNAYYYGTKRDLINLIYSDLTKSAKSNYQKFSPEIVMQRFKEVFLK